ncbi:competence protein ComEC [Hydrogenovibrio sp. 3SP14C1]|uniref:ComEC/Rec2 family competence protein n=1 Tax=Hydrogenovibrio sp. 3SP14C1 TaxID=3038774 RepID=UPI0024160911|nr:competence protein ComEC [Hydrogenovibrio sp. 3SP14C1]MDG4813466.1 competence protein ComEC [Hydrogenovibrio sp. 3SP14C1]
MVDYFEIDFLPVGEKTSGDAIAIRYQKDRNIYIHVVDGGYQKNGEELIEHINEYYDNPTFIDHVVATHNDQDHTCGLKEVLNTYEVGCLWIHRPWEYADELVHRFKRFKNVDNLAKRLKDIYCNLAALEEIAIEKNIPIQEPFQGESIGHFKVMAPSKELFLQLVEESEKTPALVDKTESIFTTFISEIVNYVKSSWGQENFSNENTSAENEMSVVQYAYLNSQKILLTGDSGRRGLTETIGYSPMAGLSLPGIHKLQVPHHGSRRNLSSDLLDQIVGSRLKTAPDEDDYTFSAVISAGKEDKKHPRNVVTRAMHHRGGKPLSTKGNTLRVSKNAPKRDNWSSATHLEYPDDQEE